MKSNRLFLLLLSTGMVSALASCASHEGEQSDTPVSDPSSASSLVSSDESQGSIESKPASSAASEASHTQASNSLSDSEESNSTAPAESKDLVAVNSDHLNIKFYDAKGNEITAAEEGTTVYVQVNSDDATQYSVNIIKLTYTTGYNSSTTKDLKSSYDENTDYYSFYVPTGVNGELKVTVTELDEKQYENSDIVGQYIQMKFNGYKFTGASEFVSEDQWDDTPIEVQANGLVMINDESKNMITSIEGEVAKTDHYSDLYFGNNLLLIGDINNTTGAISTPFTNDYNHLFVKKENATDDNSLYTNAALSFGYNGNKYLFVQVWRDGQDYASMFYESVGKTYTLNPTFSFINAETKVSADKGQFEVLVDNEVSLAIGYKDEGGRGNRIIMEGIYGEFHHNEDVINFLGNGYAVLNDVNYAVSTSEGNYVLSSNTRKLTISLDLEAKTYAVINDEEIEAGEPFKGHTYRGSLYDYDHDLYYFFMTFDETEDTYYSCVGTSSTISMDNLPYNCWMNNSTNSSRHADPQTYTYDAATGVLTTTIFDVANRNGTEMTFVYSQALDNFTCTKNYNASGFNNTSGMVLSLVA